MIEICREAEAVKAINAILNNRGIAEVKIERGEVVVVEISRTLKTAKK